MIEKIDYKISILSLLEKRSPGKSICPSEVLEGDCKKDKVLMAEVRKCAIELAHQGIISITQKGKAVDPDNFKGPIRLIKN